MWRTWWLSQSVGNSSSTVFKSSPMSLFFLQELRGPLVKWWILKQANYTKMKGACYKEAEISGLSTKPFFWTVLRLFKDIMLNDQRNTYYLSINVWKHQKIAGLKKCKGACLGIRRCYSKKQQKPNPKPKGTIGQVCWFSGRKAKQMNCALTCKKAETLIINHVATSRG